MGNLTKCTFHQNDLPLCSGSLKQPHPTPKPLKMCTNWCQLGPKGSQTPPNWTAAGPLRALQPGPVTGVTAAAAAPGCPKWHPNDPCIDPIRCQWVPRNASKHPSARAMPGPGRWRSDCPRHSQIINRKCFARNPHDSFRRNSERATRSRSAIIFEV